MALSVRYMCTVAVLDHSNLPTALFVHTILPVGVTTMSNSGSYLVTLVTLQPYSSTLVALSCSGHGCTDILPLSMTIGLFPIQSLLHLAIYPALT